MEIEQRLTSEERDLGGVMESLATMLEEVNEFSAAVSQNMTCLSKSLMLSIRIHSWQGPHPTAHNQTIASRGRRFVLKIKSYTSYENRVVPRNTGWCLRV